MNKEVIYIDVEDDVTAIIGKVKATTKNIVALVPPRQSGVLQSAVNLRLLDRAAKRDSKKLVIVSSDSALTALAASAGIPIAKNLQSKPEVPEIAAIDINNGEEVIDGSSIAVGEHASSVGLAGGEGIDDAVEAVSLEEAENAHATTKKSSKKPKNGKKGPKVPDFSIFRKKLIIIGSLVAIVIAFLVWAIVFAPHATIAIKARTTDVGVSQQVSISPDNKLSSEEMKLTAVEKTGKVEVDSDFKATGTKNVGDKATGTVTMEVCSGLSAPADVPAGTTLSAGDNTYTTTAAASFAFDHIGNGCIVYQSGSVGITATEGGESYNTSGTFSVEGGITAQGSASGGTDKTTPVVTSSDISKAIEAVKKDFDEDKAKADLEKEFGDSFVVLADSITVDTSKLKSSIAADGDAEGKTPAVTGSITYKMLGVSKDELKSYLSDTIKAQLENPDSQKVYDSGVDTVDISNIHSTKTGVTATLIAKGKVGPTIDEEAVKDTARGKKQGEVEGQLKQINGVESVKVNFSPFWVNVVPNNVQKITVQFDVNG